jgi:endonuclease III
MHGLRTRKRRAQKAVEALKKLHGSPRLNNKDDPLDELLFILLSQMTTGPSYERVFDRLKESLSSWDELLHIEAAQLTRLVAVAGLSSQKAPRMQQIARRLKQDFGAVTLSPLAGMDDPSALNYLTSLPGVGTKSAKCVMMYSLGRPVLPVDTHTARLAFRLGLVSSPDPKSVDREIEGVIASSQRYDFHVNALAHGRAVCRAIRPLCTQCAVRRLCPTGRVATSRQVPPE